MTESFVTALNTVSGKVGPVPVEYLEHPHFKDQLVLVEDGQKPYASGLYRPKTADEYVSGYTRGADVAESDEPDADTFDSDDNEMEEN